MDNFNLKNFINENNLGAYSKLEGQKRDVDGDGDIDSDDYMEYSILPITFGIIIGIHHIATKLGLTFNLRQGSYHDVKFHKQELE